MAVSRHRTAVDPYDPSDLVPAFPAGAQMAWKDTDRCHPGGQRLRPGRHRGRRRAHLRGLVRRRGAVVHCISRLLIYARRLPTEATERHMQKRKLGRSGIEVAPLALGGNVFGWTADEAKSFAVLDGFVGAGFNLVDTADVYSVWAPGHKGGESE